MKKIRKNLVVAGILLALFAVWTVLISFVDVKEIGPLESEVGFASLNGFFHNLTGVNMSLYTVTDWLGLVPIGFAVGFALLGLIQWIKRKSFWKVDSDILLLGGFYLAVMGIYLFFEEFPINFRPVLIEGTLEASYPSSTTLLVVCVMPTALLQLNVRIQKKILKRWVSSAIIAFTVFMVAGRLFAGVHWLTDIVGGGLLSAGLVRLYRFYYQLFSGEE